MYQLGALFSLRLLRCVLLSQRMGERQGDRLYCVQGPLVDNGNHRDDSPAYSGISSRWISGGVIGE
jgi:hypothetical protein